MPTICLDTSAWLEYFNAGPKGPRVRQLLETSARSVTPAPVAAELIEAARRRKLNSKLMIAFLRSRSDVVALNAEVARLAGRINAQQVDVEGWTMMESFVLATARYTKARLYTRDPIFAGLPIVTMLGEITGAAEPGASASGTTGPTEPGPAPDSP